MVTSNEHLILSAEGFDDVEMYLNSKNEIFISNMKEFAEGWCFVINKEDWEEIKKFIDYQFS